MILGSSKAPQMKGNKIKMTNEELIKLARNGDKEAFEALFKNNEGLCVSVAKMYPNNLMELEDRIAICKLNMVKAYKNYKSNNGAFSTFAHSYMTNALINEFEKSNCLKRTANVTSLEKTQMKLSRGEEIQLKDMIVDESKRNDFAKIESKVLAESITSYFYKIADQYERKYFDLIFIQGNSQTDTAKICGVVKQRVNNVYKKILQKLQIAAQECNITIDDVA